MRLLSVLLIFSLVFGACALLYGQKKVSDDEIYDLVKRKLAADRDVRGGGIGVEVREGVVTLRGKVREEKQKKKAERLARKVKGVSQVINELAVAQY